MNGLSVVIPSKNIDNLIPCVEAVRKHEPDARIIIVDDGVNFNEWECVGLVTDDLAQRGIVLIEGVKPFVFARNVNLGIVAAGEDDVILANDDTILESPSGFSLMQAALESNRDIGLISATTNFAGNPEQFRRKDSSGFRVLSRPTPGNSFPTVAFVCVLLPRRTINAVGLLDEQFVPGCFEDNDYCRRTRDAGLKMAVHDGCYVDHGSLVSTFRGAPASGAKLDACRAIYMEKWKSI